MNITAKDIGRKVRLRNGEIVTIEDIEEGAIYPVLVEDKVYTLEGKYDKNSSRSKFDMIEFVDEPKEENMEEWKSLDELMEGVKPGGKVFVNLYGSNFTPYYKSKHYWNGLDQHTESRRWCDDEKIWKPCTPPKKTKLITMYCPIIKLIDGGYHIAGQWSDKKQVFSDDWLIVGWETKEVEIEE